MPDLQGSRDASRQAIEALIFGYADRIDAGDFEGLAELFREGCIVAVGLPPVRGRDAVLALYEGTTRRYPDDGTPHTRHITTNLQLEIDEAAGHARARSSFTVFQALADFPLQAIIVGRYDDRFRRAAGGWYFEQREMRPELYGDLSRHLLVDPPR